MRTRSDRRVLWRIAHRAGLIGALAAVTSPAAALAQGGVAAREEAFVVDYYYKARWGHAQEFIELFRKNHYPVLKNDQERGRILEVTAVAPRYHATEDGRWDYRVTIVFRNLAAAFTPNPYEEADLRRLFPDQATFQREEQRRFEILVAHWDVPLNRVDLDTRPLPK